MDIDQTAGNEPAAPSLDSGLLAIFAVSCGITVANNYANQAILGLLAEEFALTPALVSLIPVATQVGNAAGVILIAPLGDRVEHKSLIVMTIAGLIVALLAGAVAPGFAWLATCSALIGLFAAVTQQIVPFAVHLASPSQHGRVLGVVTGGILTGILLARAAAGIVADVWGWRMVYWGSAALMLATVVLLAIRLPRLTPTVNLGYVKLLQSMWTLLRSYPPLRVAITVQALIFSAFMAFWGNLAIVFQEPSYRLGPTAVGLMALIGAAGALAAPVAGNFFDRKGPAAVTSASAAVVVLSFVLLGLFQGSLAVMIVGALLMDVAVYAAHVANWARVHALEPTAHSRLNTIFISTMILGGACGAGAGGLAYSWWGWSGTCGYAAIAAGVAFVISRGFQDRKPDRAR